MEVSSLLASSNAYSDHKAQAAHNEQFVRFLSPVNTQYPDWVATGAFYTALHCVNAHAAKAGIKWKDFPLWLPFIQRRKMKPHTKRVKYVRKYCPRLFKAYNHLLNESYNARYDPLYRKGVKPSTPDTLFRMSLLFMKIA
jgi:hypothetical protein